MKFRSAFTLIELLVVITIIAVLAGIALPVFQRSMEKSRTIQDANNVRSLGTALIAYLADHDDLMFQNSKLAIAGLNGNLGGTTSEAAVTTPSKALLSPFDDRSSGATGPFPVSYAFNANCLARDFGQVKAASNFYLLAPKPRMPTGSGESVSFVGMGTTDSPAEWKQSEAKPDPPAGTHSNRRQINVGFGDGHVESVQWKVFAGDTKVVSAAENTIHWNPFPKTP